MSCINLYNETPNDAIKQLESEVLTHLYHLQIYCVRLLSNACHDAFERKRLSELIGKFLSTNIHYYLKKGVDFGYLLQVNSVLIKVLQSDICDVNENELGRLKQFIMVGLTVHQLARHLPEDSTLISTILSDVYNGSLPKDTEIDIPDLEKLIINNPHLSKHLIRSVFPNSTFLDVYNSCLPAIFDLYLKEQTVFHNVILIIRECDLFSENVMNILRHLLILSFDNKCFFKHVSMEIMQSQPKYLQTKISLMLRDLIIDELLKRFGPIPDAIKDSYQQICFIFLSNGSCPMSKQDKNIFRIGWLILVTNPLGLIPVFSNLVRLLLETHRIDFLSTIFSKSKWLGSFKKLFLVNSWSPDLANVFTMEALLDICFGKTESLAATDYIDNLCIKIRNRCDTLKKFNTQLSSISSQSTVLSQDIIALTNMGNTSNLELIVGLPDPTGIDVKVIIDLLERSCSTKESISAQRSSNIDSENVEEICDKSIYFSSVIIRKVWECLILNSSYDKRRTIFDILHQHDKLINVDLIRYENSFIYQFRLALQENDFNRAEEVYQRVILEKLSFLQSHIDEIRPLSLRLELLENVYSLLFTTEFDLYNLFLSDNQTTRTTWSMPEITIDKSDQNSFSAESLNSANILNKNKFVCSFFICKDILVILEHHLNILSHQTAISHSKFSVSQKADSVLADYISYPYFDTLNVRIARMSKSLSDFFWRIQILSVNKIDFLYDSVGKINSSIHVIFDSDSRQFSDINRPRNYQKTRSKSSVTGRNLQPSHLKSRTLSDNLKVHRENRSSIGEDIEELRCKSPAYCPSILSNLSNTGSVQNIHKDGFFLFPSYTYPDLLGSNDETGVSDMEPNLVRLGQCKRMSYQFFMDCLEWIVEPIEYLTMKTLHCGFKNKADEIVQTFKTSTTNNVIFEDLLTEIKYRDTFVKFVEDLSQITLPVIEDRIPESRNIQTKQIEFGNFNWSDISALNKKVGLKKENEITEFVNKFVTLSSKDRPTFKSVDPIVTRSDNDQVKLFNAGLLFDVMICGSKRIWHLEKMLDKIESSLPPTSEMMFSDQVSKSGDNLLYQRIPGLVFLVSLIKESLLNSDKEENITYKDLELNSVIDHNYSTISMNWSYELRQKFRLLESGVEESVDSVNVIGNSVNRWESLNVLISFINKNCAQVERDNVPYRYLTRSSPLYLDMLYSHLESFVTFLRKHQNISDLSVSRLRNEFSILKKSPLNALGELIFLKSISPKSCEMQNLCLELGLNVSEVVLENCLPHISCTHSKDNSSHDSHASYQNYIYNIPAGSVKVEGTLNPLTVVTDCLKTIIKLLSKNSNLSNNANIQFDEETLSIKSTSHMAERLWIQTFSKGSSTSSESSVRTKDSAKESMRSSKTKDSTKESIKYSTKSDIVHVKTSSVILEISCHELCAIYLDDDWKMFSTVEIANLARVDMDLLTTQEEKAAFFLNLYNVMTIHMIIIAVQAGKTTFKFRNLESKLLRCSFSYKIGSLGCVSIDQVSQCFLNIPDVTFSDVDYRNSTYVSFIPTSMEDKYRVYDCYFQSLIVFGMVDGTSSSPPLKIYVPENVVGELQSNLSCIMKYMSTCDTDKRQICLPQLFKWYNHFIVYNARRNVVRSQSISQLSKPTVSPDEDLIDRILSNCTDKVAQKYCRLLKLDTESMIFNKKEHTMAMKSVKIIWKPRSESIRLLVLIKTKDSLKNTEINATSNVEPSSDNYSKNSANYITSTSASYQPTIESLDYLRKVSPLLACFAYTIIGDDFVTLKSLRTESSMSHNFDEKLQEICSYKCSRLTGDFNAIGNWICRYWTSWIQSKKIDESLLFSEINYSDGVVLYCCEKIPMEIRWAAFNHPLSRELTEVLLDYSLQLMSEKLNNYLLIGNALRKLHRLILDSCPKMSFLLDVLLTKSARYWASGLIKIQQTKSCQPPDSNELFDDAAHTQELRLLDCIYAMKDNDLRLSESLRYLDVISIHNVVPLMEFNYKLNPENDSLKEQVQNLRIFHDIHDLVLNCQTNVLNPWPSEFLDWHKLYTNSLQSPERVFKFLIQQKHFDLCKAWCKMFMPNDGEEKTEAEYLVSLVDENSKSQIIDLISHMEKLYQDGGCLKLLKVVNFIIFHSEAPLVIILCCAYVIKKDLFSELSSKDYDSSWQDRINKAWVGASMIRLIPSLLRDYYSQLIEYPHLILEQLIMNSEIDLLRKLVDLYKDQRKVYFNMKKSRACSGSQPSSISSDDFISELETDNVNRMLLEYINKALELPALKDDDDSDCDDVSVSSKFSRRGSICSIKPELTSSGEFNETYISSKSSAVDLRQPSLPNAFVMPSSPPHPSKWVKDKDAPTCMCCKKEVFSMFNRRHHCRYCGRVICAQCSTHRMIINGVTVRVCSDCHSASESRFRSNSDHISHLAAQALFNRHNIPRECDSPNSPTSGNVTDIDTVDITEAHPHNDVGALENGWRLSTNPDENDFIRQIFYYDEAPSVTMAFSLADFHSNSNECGNFLLDRVNYLADFLKSLKSGLPNPEVDYLLVIDISKRITYKAKLKFSRLNNDVDFARAEDYLSRLDLLGELVRSNYGNALPPMGDVSKFREKIEHLRDRLIREERLDLALTISSKAGLSNDPVFVAMGLNALDEERYDDARRLFASCNRTVRFNTMSSQILPYPVNEIMRILEGNKISPEMIKDILSNMQDKDELLDFPEKKYNMNMTTKRITEAIYYLDYYSATLHCLQFLCRHELWSKALEYAMEKNVSRELFIDGLVAPSVTSGHFSCIAEEMIENEKWKNHFERNYYDILCSYLDKKGRVDDLLKIQENSNDHQKAAGTLIHYFYLKNSKSYLDLLNNLNSLEKAKYHFERLTSRGSDNSTEMKTFTRKLDLIKQQIEATKFLNHQISVSHHEAGFGYLPKLSRPPTLFGGNDSIIDFCLSILFCRPNISDCLQFLCPLMTQCHIYPEFILPKAAVWLLENPCTILPNKGCETETGGVSAGYELCLQVSICYRLDLKKSDELLISILRVIPLSLLVKSQLMNKFMALFKSEQKKIDAFIIVKDFKRAFHKASTLGYISEVEKILNLAENADDMSDVTDLCRHWLSLTKSSK